MAFLSPDRKLDRKPGSYRTAGSQRNRTAGILLQAPSRRQQKQKNRALRLPKRITGNSSTIPVMEEQPTIHKEWAAPFGSKCRVRPPSAAPHPCRASHGHMACVNGWLTFDSQGEMIVLVGRNCSLAPALDAIPALLAHLYFLHPGSRLLRVRNSERGGPIRTPVVAPKKIRKFDTKTFLSTIDGGRRIAAFPKKQTIFAQGAPSDAVFYIQEGKVKLTVVSQIGKEATIGILNEGDFLAPVLRNRNDRLLRDANR